MKCQVCGKTKGDFKAFYRRGENDYQPTESEGHLLDDEYYVFGCSPECHTALMIETWSDSQLEFYLLKNIVTRLQADYNNLEQRFSDILRVKGKKKKTRKKREQEEKDVYEIYR